MRVKTGPVRRARHKKVLKAAKGYRMTKNRLYRVAHEAVLHAGQYAYAGRKKRKRDLRRLWITRLHAALEGENIKYSRFINLLKKEKIELNRKILAHLALYDPKSFKALLTKIKTPAKKNSSSQDGKSN